MYYVLLKGWESKRDKSHYYRAGGADGRLLDTFCLKVKSCVCRYELGCLGHLVNLVKADFEKSV